MQNISSLANGDHPFKRFSAKKTTLNSANPSSVGGGTDVSALLHASIVQNCSLWDSLGIGFVADPGKKVAGGQGPPSVADSSFVTLWLLDSKKDQAFVGYDSISSLNLEYAVSRITADAASMLDQQVAQELATTDSTRTWLGALWDMSVVILGIVAMACGRKETEAWISGWLWKKWGQRTARGKPINKASPAVLEPSQGSKLLAEKRCRIVVRVAKLVYCIIIVPLGLVMAPAIVLASDFAARQQNASGKSSKVGWLAVEMRRGGLTPSDKYVLVGAVTVRNTAISDDAALALLVVNVILAVVGMLCIGMVSKKSFADDCASCELPASS
jgi:hypothetical protein